MATEHTHICDRCGRTETTNSIFSPHNWVAIEIFYEQKYFSRARIKVTRPDKYLFCSIKCATEFLLERDK